MLRKKTLASRVALLPFILLFATSSFADELAQIQSAIRAEGAGWTAGDTSVSRLPSQERRMRLGLIVPQLTGKEKTLPYVRASSEPASLDWRNNNGDYVTPIRDQGACGSCWAFAATGALESATLIAQSTPNVDLNLAEQILVSCAREAGDCGGGYVELASDFVRDTGLPLESCFPYKATNGNCDNACSTWRNSTYKIEDWDYVATVSPTVSALRSALYSYGPLVTTFDVYADFYYYTGGVYSHTSGSLQGGHAVLLVGYNDANQYFIVKNSWGTDWGESGYFRIAYSQLSGPVNFGQYTLAYTASPDTPEPFALISPLNGVTVSSPPTFQWNPGSFDVLKLYSYFSYGNGYRSVSFWLPSNTTSLPMPSSWWNMLKAGTAHYWAILGINSVTKEWQVAGPWTFKKN